MSDKEKETNKDWGRQAMADNVSTKIAEENLGLPILALRQLHSGDIEVLLASEEKAARLRENKS